MPVLIKRYANRKLYNTQTSRYITLKGIAELLEQDEDVRVIDNETGEDITSITLSQILVDTERSNREVSGTLLTGLLQKGGDALYTALRRRMDDASGGIEEIQGRLKQVLGARDREQGRPGDWIAFTPPDLDDLVQRTLERVFKVLDLPRRADVEALNQRLDRVSAALEALEKDRQDPAARGSADVSPPSPDAS